MFVANPPASTQKPAAVTVNASKMYVNISSLAYSILFGRSLILGLLLPSPVPLSVLAIIISSWERPCAALELGIFMVINTFTHRPPHTRTTGHHHQFAISGAVYRIHLYIHIHLCGPISLVLAFNIRARVRYVSFSRSTLA